MALIEKPAMDALLEPVRGKQQEELSDLQSKNRMARAKRRAAAQFDIQQAMGAGDMAGVRKIQTQAARADAIDRSTEDALQGEHAIEQQDAARRQSADWDQVTADRGPGGYAGTGVMRKQDVTVLPPKLAGMRPSPAQLVADAKGRASSWGPTDDLYASRALGSQKMFDTAQHDVTTANKSAFDQNIAALHADQAAAYDEGRKRATAAAPGRVDRALSNFFDPIDARVNPKPRPVGTLTTSDGATYRSQGGVLKPNFDTPADIPPDAPEWKPQRWMQMMTFDRRAPAQAPAVRQPIAH